jgi:hypothetical protein
MSRGKLEGVLLLAPAGLETAPAVRAEGERAERAIAGHEIRVLDQDGRAVARLETDAQGRFHIELAPGSYRLVTAPLPGMLAGEGDELEVQAGEISRVELRIDTGVR